MKSGLVETSVVEPKARTGVGMGVGMNIVKMSTRPGSFVEEVRGPGPGKEGQLV